MKFSVKIFWTYICIYLLVMTIVGITMTENSYNSMKEQEIRRSSAEADNMVSTIKLYLLNSKPLNSAQINLADYGASIVDLFSSSSSYLEVFDENLQLIATNSPAIWNSDRAELSAVAAGQRSIILRHDEVGRYYLFICDYLEKIDGQGLIISTVKDITHLDDQRHDQYVFLVEIGCIGLLVVAVIVALLSKVLIKPIKNLDKAAQSIAAGNYNERVQITSNDEVGSLALQFNLMAAEVEGKIQQLEQESYRQQRFVDNLTHELRTPLTSIIGYAELLQKMDYQPAIFNKSLGYIYHEGKRMLSLNKMLMDLTFYREGQLEMLRGEVLPLLREVQEMMAVRATAKTVSIVIEGDDFALMMAPDLLKSALINLTDNGLKASPKGGVLTLGMKVAATQRMLYVADQGQGMKAEELERIKEPFYRVDKARSRKDGGVGLGVAICDQIIMRHGGRLTYESTVGTGTTAWIIFEDAEQDESQ